MYRNQKKSFVKIRAPSFSHAINLGVPLGSKKNFIQIGVYSKRLARPHGFNKANDKFIQVRRAEIS